MLNDLNPGRAAFLIFIVALATISGAWIFQYLGYPPCHLCLQQRWAYYIAIPLALATGLLAEHNTAAAKGLLYLLALIWLGSMIFGIYHSGVEWKWWPGPDTCGGDLSGGLPNLSGPVIRCDEAAIRILGLSLAGWNAVISLGLAAVAFIGASRQGSSSVSQYR
jgi:disulfide bond formation protein DsbB